MLALKENHRSFVARTLPIVYMMVPLLGIYGCSYIKERSVAAELRDAVAELEDGGGEVMLNDKNEESSMKLIGFDLTDADLENWINRLNGLTALEQLDIRGATITDAAVGYLKGLTTLREVGLASTGITDVGLEHLKELKNLEKLELALHPARNPTPFEFAAVPAMRLVVFPRAAKVRRRFRRRRCR